MIESRIDVKTLDPNAGPIGKKASDAQIDAWVEQFHRDGFLLLHDVLPVELIPTLKADLDGALNVVPKTGAMLELKMRMFEISKVNQAIFELEPVVSFAEKLVKYDCHVVHNNSFRTPPGGGISMWHQDDPLHYEVTDGKPPTNVRLPVMLFTANYYLTDVEEVEVWAYGGDSGIAFVWRLSARVDGWGEVGEIDRVMHGEGGERDHVQQSGLAPWWAELIGSRALHDAGELCPTDHWASVFSVYELPDA